MAAPNINTADHIGDLLVREGLINRQQLAAALQEQKQSGTRVGYNLVKLGHISEIADGDPPHAPRGCPFQAWSVGEALRLELTVLTE